MRQLRDDTHRKRGIDVRLWDATLSGTLCSRIFGGTRSATQAECIT
jgi:hypothetical protein